MDRIIESIEGFPYRRAAASADNRATAAEKR